MTPLVVDDARAVVDAEDDDIIRWLSGGRSTLDGTRAYIERLDREAAAGASKRAFAIRVDGVCVGTIDVDASALDGLEPGDVNIAYGLAPGHRGRGVTTRAVELVCAIIHERGIGTRAVIRTDRRNPASARVAEKAGFRWLRDVVSSTEADTTGEPVILRVFGRALP